MGDNMNKKPMIDNQKEYIDMKNHDYDVDRFFDVYCSVVSTSSMLSGLCVSDSTLQIDDLASPLRLMSESLANFYDQLEQDYKELGEFREADLKRQKKGKKGG